MNISRYLLQRYAPTQKRYVWALALLYMLPVSTLGAQESPEEIIEFIEKDVTTIKKASDEKKKVIEKNQLKSAWAQGKIEGDSIELATFIEKLKEDSDSIIEAASTLLISNGSNTYIREQLDLLIKSNLISKNKFKLDNLTLARLTKLYEVEEKIEVITDILKENKDKVLERVVDELNQGEDSWKHLYDLLHDNSKKRISKQVLSYETINIPLKLLISNSKNYYCRSIIKSIVSKNRQKGLDYIKDALEKENLNEENVWYFLYRIISETTYFDKINLKDEKATEALKAFTVDNYIVGVSNYKAAATVKDLAIDIFENSATAKRFGGEAINLLNNNKIFFWYIWETLDQLIEKGTNLELQLLLYENWSWGLYSGKLKKCMKEHPQTAKLVAKEAFKKDNQKVFFFWDLLHFLIVDEDGPKIDPQEIDVENMNLETAIRGAKERPEALIEIFKKKKNKEKAIKLFKEALKEDLTKNSELTKLLLLQNLVKELKKDSDSIIEAASTLLINSGSNTYIREQLDLLIKNNLISKNKFKLDNLTLATLTKLYEVEEKIEVITNILQTQKDKVFDIVIYELNQERDSWEHLEKLLNYKDKEGIPGLGLSYETINIPLELLIVNNRINDSCERITEEIANKQGKAASFIKSALKNENLEKEKVWHFLHLMVEKNPGTIADNSTFEEFTAKKYIEGGYRAHDFAEKIIKGNGTIAKRFAKEAFEVLKGLRDPDSIRNIWEAISYLDYDAHVKEANPQLKGFNYHQLLDLSSELAFLSKKKEMLRSLLKDNHLTASELAKEAFQEKNQSSERFWGLLYFFMEDEDGPKVKAQDIGFEGITFETALKAVKEERSSDILVKFLELEKNKDIVKNLGKEALKGDLTEDNRYRLLLWILEKYKIKITPENLTAEKVIEMWEIDNAREIYKEILDQNRETAIVIADALFNKDGLEGWNVLDWILNRSKIEYPEEIIAENLTADKVIKMWKKPRNQGVYKKILKEKLQTAKGIANELCNSNDLNRWEVLHWLICDKQIVKASDVNIESFNIETVKEVFKRNQENEKEVMTKLLKSDPKKATKLVEDILNNGDKLKKSNGSIEKIKLLSWLTTNDQNERKAPVSSQDISISKECVLKICKEIAPWKSNYNTTHFMLGIVKNVIEKTPKLGEDVLQLAVNDIEFGVLHLLMEHEKGPQLTIKKADIGNLELSEIKKYLEDKEAPIVKEKTLIVIKKILRENKSGNKSFYWGIFPPKDISMRDKPFNYKSVDWDNTKWNDIEGFESLIGPIPADIVIEKLKVEDKNFLNFFLKILQYYDEKQEENLLKHAFPNIKINDGVCNEVLSEVNWDIVKLFVDKGVIEPESVIKEVLPGITSTHEQFKKDYSLSKVNWKKFDEKAFPKLVKYKIAEFSIEDYQTIAKKVLPGLAFTNEGVQASKVDWEKVKGFTTINYLIEKETIPEKILVKMPGSAQKKLAASVVLNPAQAGLLEKVKEQKSIYRRNAVLWLGTFVLGCTIVFYALPKKENRESPRAKKTQNRRGIKKMSKNKPQQKRKRQSKKIQNKE